MTLFRSLLLAALIVLPAAGWYGAPRISLMMAGSCEARTLNVYIEKDRSVITREKWWFSPGFWGASGTYHAEIIFQDRDGRETIRHADRAYELRYHVEGSYLQAETLRVAPLREENRAGPELSRYIDPLVKEGFRAPAFIYSLPGNNIMVGLNNLPRTLCMPLTKRD